MPARSTSASTPCQRPTPASATTTANATERSDAAHRPSGETAPVALPDGSSAGRPRHATTASPGELLRELAVEDDHGPHVLERGGESQLTHQARPVAQLFERRVPDPDETDDRDREREHDPDERERGPRERQGARPDRSARWGTWRVRTRRRPPTRRPPGAPTRLASRARSRTPDATNADPQTASEANTPNAAPASNHSTRLAAERARGDAARDGAAHGGDQDDAPELANRERAQDLGARDGSEQQERDVGRFGGQWPAVRTRTKAQQHQERDREAEDGGAVLLHVVEGGGVALGTQGDGAVEQSDRRHDADDVRLVQRVDPVALPQVVATAGAPERSERALRARAVVHRRSLRVRVRRPRLEDHAPRITRRGARLRRRSTRRPRLPPRAGCRRPPRSSTSRCRRSGGSC